MITHIYSEIDGERLSLELRRPELSGLTVLSVTGLGAAEGTINTLAGPNIRGARFNSAQHRQRNIEIQLATTGDFPEDLREKLYKFFPVTGKITFGVTTKTRTSIVDAAYIETNEANIFAKISNQSITLVCPSAFFRDLIRGSFELSGVEAGFVFPFSNDSLTENLLDFGTISKTPQKFITNVGGVDVGFRITINFLGPTGDISIYNNSMNETMTIDMDILTGLIGGPIVEGDIVFISTVIGDKHIYHIRNGVVTNIINALPIYTPWVRLGKGVNEMTMTSIPDMNNVQAIFEYDVLRLGV